MLLSLTISSGPRDSRCSACAESLNKWHFRSVFIILHPDWVLYVNVNSITSYFSMLIHAIWNLLKKKEGMQVFHTLCISTGKRGMMTSTFISRFSEAGMGFNKHWQPTSFISYFAQGSRLLFSPKGEATSAYNVVNKKHIMKTYRPTGFELHVCLSYANAVFQSILHTFQRRFTQNLFLFKCTFVHCL